MAASTRLAGSVPHLAASDMTGENQRRPTDESGECILHIQADFIRKARNSPHIDH